MATFIIVFSFVQLTQSVAATPAPIPYPVIRPNDWSVFGGDTAHTGYKPVHLLINDEFTPQFAWNATKHWHNPNTTNVPGSLAYGIVSKGYYINLIYNGLGSDQPTVIILNATTGADIQSFVLSRASNTDRGTAPILAFSIEGIYIAVQNTNGEPTFGYTIYNITDPQQMWYKYDTSPLSAWYPHGVTPSNHEGIVYFQGGPAAGSDSTRIWAVDYKTGNGLFFKRFPYIGSCDVWVPTIYNKQLFVNSQVSISELDPLNGSVLWTNRYTQNQTNYGGCFVGWTLSISNNIALATDRSGYWFAVNITTGKVVWNTNTQCNGGHLYDRTAATDGIYAYMACGDVIKSFYLLTGKQHVIYNCSSNGTIRGCWGQPIVTKSHIFANSDVGVKVFDKMKTNLIYQFNEVGGSIALSYYVNNQTNKTQLQTMLHITDWDNAVITAYFV